MNGNEMLVKLVGLGVLAGIAQKVLTVIMPRTVETLRTPMRAVGDSAAAVASTAAKTATDKLLNG